MKKSALLAFSILFAACSNDPDPEAAKPEDSGADSGTVDAPIDSTVDSAMDSVADEGSDTTTSDGTTSDSTTSDGTTDSGSDVSDAPMACVGDAGADADAAPICPVGKWRDYEDGTCNACPSPTLKCSTSLYLTPNYDTTTRRLTVTLKISQAQLVSGTVKVSYTTGSCTATGPGSGAIVSTADLPVEVKDDQFFVDLSAVGVASVRPCGSATFKLLDACCTTHEHTFDIFYDDSAVNTHIVCAAGD
ncbi:MAG: hypothetical protein ACXVEF_19025 [Polyangiales bacterium]